MSLLAVTIVSTIASTTDVFTEVIGDGIKGVLPVITVLVVGTGLTYLFRFAATGQHSFWRAAPGGFTLAVLWQLLQLGGAAYVDRVLVNTSSMTKTFGLVLGLIGFLWIGAVMAVLAIEVNVVLARRLWPRALLTPFTDNVELTDADREAYALYARMQRHKGFEKVSVAGSRGRPSGCPTRRPTSRRDELSHRRPRRDRRGGGPRLALPVHAAPRRRRGRGACARGVRCGASTGTHGTTARPSCSARTVPSSAPPTTASRPGRPARRCWRCFAAPGSATWRPW